MNEYNVKLIGELIGLARATDGNEHLICDDSTSVIRICLAAEPDSCEELKEYLSRVEDAKRAMVPDCFLCANPCGKNAAFDLSELEHQSAAVKEAKYRIIDNLIQFSGSAPGLALYRGLIALGVDGLSPEFLESIAGELNP